jgi:conjugative transfer signal peptidase TraF
MWLRVATPLALLLLAWPRSSPSYVLNLSESMPRGIYALSDEGEIAIGDDVLIELPSELRSFAVTTNWFSPSAPLLKRVAAVEGATLCVSGNGSTLNGANVGELAASDSNGAKLPRFSGCQTVPTNHFVALGESTPHSFDSRYFGALPESLIKKKAKLIFAF